MDLDSAKEQSVHEARQVLTNHMLRGSCKMRDNLNMSANDESPASSSRPPPVGFPPGGDVPGQAEALSRAKELRRKAQSGRRKLAVVKAAPAPPPPRCGHAVGSRAWRGDPSGRRVRGLTPAIDRYLPSAAAADPHVLRRRQVRGDGDRDRHRRFSCQPPGSWARNFTLISTRHQSL